MLHRVEAGSGPLLVCLHGIGSSAESFEPQLTGLHRDLRVVAWDAPGYGKSLDPDHPLGLDGFVDAAAAFIGELDGPAHVLGVSFGGVVALRLALRHPSVVRSLILASTSCGSGRTLELAAAMRARAAQLAELGSEAFARARAPRLVSSNTSPELVERVIAIMASAVRLPGYGYAAAAMAAADLTPALPDIALPTLVICGDDDEVTGVPESQAISGAIPSAVLVIMAGTGHLANQENPEAFNAWVASHVDIAERLAS